MKTKFFHLAISFFFSLMILMLSLRVYTEVSRDPVIFFFSIIIIIIITIINFISITIFFKNTYDLFARLLFAKVIAGGLFVISVFGPVFIDRSISYHLVFSAVQNGIINSAEFERRFSHQTYEKRIKEAELSGFIKKEDGLNYSPTLKAKIFSKLMLQFGGLTGSDKEYLSVFKK